MIAILHLLLAATWLGSMLYSLTVVQPKVDRFFPDHEQREEFLVTLAHGNRWRVVALIAVLLLTAAAEAILSPGHRIGFLIAFLLYAAAAGVFSHVSWRHWPRRVFALPGELPGFRRRLRLQAWAMLGLVGTAYLVTLTVSVLR